MFGRSKSQNPPPAAPPQDGADKRRKFGFPRIGLVVPHVFGRSKAPNPPPPILPQYGADKRRMHWFLRIGLVAFCFVYGFFFALMAPALMTIFAVPVVSVGLLALWALPEMRTAPTRLLEKLLFTFFTALIVWPNYLSIVLPGMPWITVLRLTSFPLTIVLLLCTSISPKFREAVADSLGSIPMVNRLVLIFIVMQIVSVAFSAEKGFSIERLIVYQTSWTAVFFASAYVFRKPGTVERFAFLLWAMAIFVGLIGVVEHKLGHVPWFGHIPSFLKADEMIDIAMAGTVRAGVNAYRVQGPFSTSLGLAEYIAYAFPFIIYFAINKYPLWIRAAAVLSMPFLIVVIDFSGSRLGMVGCFMSVLISTFVAAVQKWRRDKNSIIGGAIIFGSPFLFCIVVGGALTIGRVRHKLLGGGGEQSSTDARVEQMHMGLPKIISHPWGHGIGMAGQALGYVTPAGFTTIDSYYLNVALEFGPLGFIVFFAIFGWAAFEGIRRLILWKPKDPEQAFLAPLSIAVLNFFVIKSVFSQADNHPLIYAMLGAILALASRYAPREKRGAAPVLAQAAPTRTLALGPGRRQPDPVQGSAF